MFNTCIDNISCTLLIVDFDPTETGASLDPLAAIKAPRLVMLPFGQNPPETPRDGQLYNFISKPIKNSSFYHAILVIEISRDEEPEFIRAAADRKLGVCSRGSLQNFSCCRGWTRFSFHLTEDLASSGGF